MPESVRSYMTIEEVRALIATPVQDGRVKNAYLFSCFCGLRISDIVGLKWKNVFVDNGQYRLAVAMQKTKEPIYLPLSNEALKWMPEREDKAADDHVFSLLQTSTSISSRGPKRPESPSVLLFTRPGTHSRP